MRHRVACLLLLGALLASPLPASCDPPDFNADDRAIFSDIVTEAQAAKLDAAPFAQIVQAIATQPRLLGRPYANAPLDSPDAAGTERLEAGFGRFDCVTFVETVLALSQTIARGQVSEADYLRSLAALRYRAAQSAYCARLHYFSDWIQSNADAGRLDEVTAEVAGGSARLAFRPLPHGLDHLSRHAATNPALAGNPARQACMHDAEQAVLARLAQNEKGQPGIAYIPSTRLAETLPRLRGGDLLAWVTDRPGLDVVHVGIVIERDGRRGLAHASQRNGRVAVAPDLLRYAASLHAQLGVRVLRPRDPR